MSERLKNAFHCVGRYVSKNAKPLSRFAVIALLAGTCAACNIEGGKMDGKKEPEKPLIEPSKPIFTFDVIRMPDGKIDYERTTLMLKLKLDEYNKNNNENIEFDKDQMDLIKKGETLLTARDYWVYSLEIDGGKITVSKTEMRNYYRALRGKEVPEFEPHHNEDFLPKPIHG